MNDSNPIAPARIRKFRIGTFNLKNLLLPHTSYYEQSGYSEAEYRTKLNWCAGQLERMRADIVGFQEVFHARALVDLCQKTEQTPIHRVIGPEISTPGQDDDRGTLIVPQRDRTRDDDNGLPKPLPSVALWSRFPAVEQETCYIETFPEAARIQLDDDLIVPTTAFSRPVLRTRLHIHDSLELSVFVVHLKSKLADIPAGADKFDPLVRAVGAARSLIRRAAEAVALRYLLIQEMQNNARPVILLGDLNDDAHAVTSQIFSGVQMIDLDHEDRDRRQELKAANFDLLLRNVKDLQSVRSTVDTYYTHIHDGQYNSLDHILVSQEFYPKNPKQIGWVDYVQVFNDHLIDESISDESAPDYVSDHGQVVATIRLKDEGRGESGVGSEG